MFSTTSFSQRVTSVFDSLPLGFWLATLSSVFYFFAVQMTFPLVPLFITDELKASETLIGASVLIVSITEVGLRLPIGSWSDRAGRRQFMLWGAVLGILYPLVMVISYSMGVFMLGRVVHGLGLAVYVTTLRAYVGDIVPPERSGEALGINTSAFALALIFGPLTGEALKNAFDFRVAFGVGVAIASLAWFTLLLLPKAEARPNNTAAFWEGVREVLKLRGGWAALFTAMAGANVFTVLFVYFPSYAKELELEAKAPAIFGDLSISLAFSLFALVNLVTLPWAGRYSDQHGRTAALIPGLLTMIPAIAFLGAARSFALIYAAVALLAFGGSFYRAMMDALMQDACPRPLRGTGTAVLFCVWGISIGIGSQLFGWIIDEFSFDAMFATAALITLVLGAIAIGLSRHAERDRITRYKGDLVALNLPK